MKQIYKGKVADVYDLGNDLLLLKRSNRISGLNVVLRNEMPDKGAILTQLSQWWMRGPLNGIVPNHLADVTFDFFYSSDLLSFKNNSSVVKKLIPLKVEAIVRRHIFGTGYQSYLDSGMVCGIKLAKGIKEGDRLDVPIFTPTEKTKTDDHFTFDEMSDLVGVEYADEIKMLSLDIFKIAESLLLRLGIILADAKFEFGVDAEGNLYLIDEVLTPDSSRFWDAEAYYLYGKIVSYDKQKARDWLADQFQVGNWNGKSSIALPEWLIEEMHNDYVEIFTGITGEKPILL